MMAGVPGAAASPCGPLAGVSRAMQAHRSTWDAVGIFLHVVGYALTGSVVLGTYGVPLLAAHAALIYLLSGCRGDALSATAARQAAGGIGLVLDTPARLVLPQVLAALLQALRAVLLAHASGRPPAAADLAAIGRAAGLSEAEARTAGAVVAGILGGPVDSSRESVNNAGMKTPARWNMVRAKAVKAGASARIPSDRAGVALAVIAGENMGAADGGLGAISRARLIIKAHNDDVATLPDAAAVAAFVDNVYAEGQRRPIPTGRYTGPFAVGSAPDRSAPSAPSSSPVPLLLGLLALRAVL